MNNDIYWLKLQTALGQGATLVPLIRIYGGAKQFFESGEQSWRQSGVFGNDMMNLNAGKLSSLRNNNFDDCRKIEEICKENAVQIISFENELYPTLLKRLSNPPAVLYVVGDIEFLNRDLCLGVIGTRNPSQYGIEAGTEIASGLAKLGAAIISGGALGIDSIAHQSALANNAKTALVMGCGHFSGYLLQNEPLRRAVSENGALISEYPPFTAAAPFRFPMRNRIISGLSKGIVIIEASEKSGTLNTAKHAKAQGRDIFAVPGDIMSVSYAGSNKLITEGAYAAFSARDVMNYYSYTPPKDEQPQPGEERTPFDGIDKFAYGIDGESAKKQKKKTAKAKPKSSPKKAEKEEPEPQIVKVEPDDEQTEEKLALLSPNARRIYDFVTESRSALDDITRASGAPVRKVLVALTELEMSGLIVSCGAGRYCRKGSF